MSEILGKQRTECIGAEPFRDRPYNTVDDVEYATSGMIPSADFETD